MLRFFKSSVLFLCVDYLIKLEKIKQEYFGLFLLLVKISRQCADIILHHIYQMINLLDFQ